MRMRCAKVRLWASLFRRFTDLGTCWMHQCHSSVCVYEPKLRNTSNPAPIPPGTIGVRSARPPYASYSLVKIDLTARTVDVDCASSIPISLTSSLSRVVRVPMRASIIYIYAT